MTRTSGERVGLATALPQLMMLREASELRRQPMLYHYTSAAGLHGILSSGTLRASNYLYLNDTSEIEYGKNVVVQHVRDTAATFADPIHELLMEAADRLELYTRENESDPILREHAPLDVFVASFCEKPNLLSQWRAYGGAEARYCIGFDVKALRGFDLFSPARVVYERNEQLALLSETTRAIAGGTLHTLREKQIPAELGGVLPGQAPKVYSSEREIVQDAGFALQFCLDRVLCRLKHVAFAEEKEWRSTVDLSGYDQSDVLKFEVAGGKVRPYVDLLRGSEADAQRLPIREVYVGYARRPAQAKRTVELLLRHFGYRNCTVEVSDVPLLE